MQLVEKYRPQTLDDVLAQPATVRSLKAFAARPTAGAMLFHGSTGCGKTSAALALARALGCAVDEQEMGGLYQIASGEMTADQVRDRLAALRFRPFCGSGWRVLICNEADRMARAAETIWLDGLEKLGDRCLVIFTTNDPHRLSQRFRDRCEQYEFAGGSDRLRPYIAELARKIWSAEGCTGDVPGLDTLGMPTLGAAEDMEASLRLAVKQLQRLVRDHQANPTPAATLPVPADEDDEPDNCRTVNPVFSREPVQTAAKVTPPAAVSDELHTYGRRWEAGEWLSKLAREAGVPWQRLLRQLRGLGYEGHDEKGKNKVRSAV